MIIILYLLAVIFIAGTFFILATKAVVIGTRQGILEAAQILVPIFLECLQHVQSEEAKNDDIMSVLEDEASGKISEDEARKILRNIRGES